MPDVSDEPMVLCCFLWARDGEAEALSAYEDRVLRFIPDHGGTVEQRVIGDGTEGRPNEIQVYVFPNGEALNRYLTDSRRAALADERDRVIERTELFPVKLV